MGARSEVKDQVRTAGMRLKVTSERRGLGKECKVKDYERLRWHLHISSCVEGFNLVLNFEAKRASSKLIRQAEMHKTVPS